MTYMISVIIPCYNASLTIINSLQSVINQSYKNIEIIVVDDGSNDDSVGIVKDYLKKHRVVSKIILQENSGPAKARNVGIINSQGDYIAFLDCDDVWSKEKLSLQIATMKKEPQINLLATRNQNYKLKLNKDHSELELISFNRLLWANPIITSSVLVKSEVLKTYLFDVTKKYSEDYYLWGQIASANRIAVLNMPLVWYNKTSTGLSSKLVKMQKGELDTLRRWRESKYCSGSIYSIAYFYSCLRFLRRCLYYLFDNIS